MEQRIIYVGLDVHKDTIAVALAEAGKRGARRVWQDREHAGGVEDSGGEAGSESWLAPSDFAMRPALAVTAFSASRAEPGTNAS